MKKVATLNQDEREELFTETAAQMGITPAAVEKDFWLCWVLMIIFEHPELSNLLTLKGGTSLSKCYGLIDRFSEDIDLILDWTVLTKKDPYEKRSKTQQDKFNKNLNKEARKYIESKLLPILKDLMEPLCTVEIDVHDGHTINIKYPNAFHNEYLQPVIKLEIGPLASGIPSDKFLVKSYAAEVHPGLFEQPRTEVVAVEAERTFWEKVTILHAEAHRPKDKAQAVRYSRHYYDVFKMLDTLVGEKALSDRGLLDDVVNVKKQFYPSKWANYDSAIPETMELVPVKEMVAALREDYNMMKEMIFGEFPDFDTILSKLEDFQRKLNKL